MTDLIAGQILAQRYRICAHAETGGMGQVYRGLDTVTGETVAVKVLLDTLQESVIRFEHEALALLRLSHPGIVRYIAYNVTPEGAPFLVMEWLEGEDLASLLQKRRLSISETITLGVRTAEALGIAHRMGFVHRDVKPANIFLVGGLAETPKLVDFGIAYFGRSTRLTFPGTMVGTPNYVAPEQVRSDDTVKASADVFSLGCVLFECLTGVPPFQADHLIALLAKIVFEDAPRLSDAGARVPAWLDQLVARMLSRDRTKRPADGEAVALELLAGTASTKQAASTDLPPRSLGLRERRFLGVVLVGRRTDVGSAPMLAPTMAASSPETLRAIVAHFGAHLELFADGTAIVILDHSSVPTDVAAQGSRCALALSVELPEAILTVTSGWCELGRGLPVGEAVERAILLHAAGAMNAPRVTLDDMTAGLLDPRFDIVLRVTGGFELRGERAIDDAPRPMLGKATPCVGRDHEVRLLEQTFADTVAEPAAHIVVVIGAAGIGKSRLVHELVERQRRKSEPVEILWGRGDPQRAGSTYGLLADVFWRLAHITGSEKLEVRQERLRALVGRHVEGRDLDRISEFLGELAGIPFPDAESLPLRAARQDPELCGEQIRRAIRDWLRAVCATRPTMLVLEDIHWGDRASIAAVDLTLRDLAELPILVVATARPEADQMFPHLWVERGRQEIRLNALSTKASSRLVHFALGDQADGQLVERLVALADGHPFFLEELVRTASEGAMETLPETIVAMVQARLDRLLPHERRALRAASILGEVFWRGAVTFLLGAADAAEDPWASLVAAELCFRRTESRFSGEEELVFRHALLREGAYASLTDEDRTLGHRLAGQWLENAGEADPLVLAKHFEVGGMGEHAGRLYLRGAEQANARHNHEDAERYYTAASGLLGGLPALARRGRGLARFRAGLHVAAITELAEACVQAEAEGDNVLAVELLLDEAMVRDWLGDYQRAEERVLAAKARYVLGSSTLLDARLLLGIGRSALRANREEEAAATVTLAAASAERLGDEGYETRAIALLSLGFLLPFLGRLEQASAAVDQAILECEARSDFMHLGAALGNRALVRAYRGDREGMLEDSQRSITLGRELGQPRLELVAHYNVAETLYLMDDTETLEPHLRAAAAISQRRNAGVAPEIVDLLSARIQLYRNDIQGARATVVSIRKAQEKAQLNGVALLALSEDLLCAMIELAVDGGSDGDWEALEARSLSTSVGQERIEVLEARALCAFRRGKFPEAAQHFERALEVAARIPNVMEPRLRRALAETNKAISAAIL